MRKNRAWSKFNPMLDIEGNITDRHEKYGLDDHYIDLHWMIEDAIGRLVHRVSILEKSNDIEESKE